MKRRAASSSLRREDRDVRDEQRVVQARELDVVVLAARAFAELAELEPGDPGPGAIACSARPSMLRVAGRSRRRRRALRSVAGALPAFRRPGVQVGRAPVRADAADSRCRRPSAGLRHDSARVRWRAESVGAAGRPCTDPAAATLEVATRVTPRRNSPSNSPPRIIASAISATKNSSRQRTRARRAIRCATSSSGWVRPLMLPSSACTRRMKR